MNSVLDWCKRYKKFIFIITLISFFGFLVISMILPIVHDDRSLSGVIVFLYIIFLFLSIIVLILFFSLFFEEIISKFSKELIDEYTDNFENNFENNV